MNQIDQLLAIVKRGEAEEIEAARDQVTAQDMDALVAAYWTLSTVDEKSGLMHDHIAAGGREVMLDFLEIPDDPGQLNNKYVASGKVVALCQREGHFGNNEKYWYDRSLLLETARRYLAGEER